MPANEEIEDDTALLRAYSAGRSEEAFRRLVERHLPTVWNTARRLVNGDTAMAEDVSQEVFSHLARRAATLAPQTVLGGWLYRHTCFTASKAVRSAARRRAREYTAATDMNASASDPWPDIAPHLDAALQSLSAADRNAVVLRFFEKRDFRSIGAALGTSEDAARMKTSRAVEKLRSLLGRRGAVLTAAVLASLLGERAVAAPPDGMAAQVTASALTRAAGAGAGMLTKMWAALRRRKALAAAGMLVLIASVTLWAWDSQPKSPRKMHLAAAAGASGKGGKTAKDVNSPRAAVTVYFITVPESVAAALLDDRWNSDGDKAILEGLLKQTTTGGSDVVLSETLAGELPGRKDFELQKVKEIPVTTDLDSDENGQLISLSGKQNSGTTIRGSLTIGEDLPLCDLNLKIEHHFEKPVRHPLSASLTDESGSSPSTATLDEFRIVNTESQVLLASGQVILLSSSQVPLTPSNPAKRVLTFVTATVLPPS